MNLIIAELNPNWPIFLRIINMEIEKATWPHILLPKYCMANQGNKNPNNFPNN